MSLNIASPRSDIAAQLQRNLKEAYNSAGRSEDMWNPPTQPAATSATGAPVGQRITNTALQMYALYDELMLRFPDQISRTDLGLDQSGTYHIYQYTFTPPSGYYIKTGIITCNVHGQEGIGPYSVWRLFKYIVESWKVYPQLAYARNCVRFIVIPCCNPWGMHQSPRTRKNSRGVDINRNFTAFWSQGGDTDPDSAYYRGTAAMTEAEVIAIDGVFQAYPEAIFHLDIHDFGIGLQATNYAITGFAHDRSLPGSWVPRTSVAEWIQQYAYDDDGDNHHYRQYSGEIQAGTAVNQSGLFYNMHSYIVESTSGYYSSTLGDAAEMTGMLRWYGNMVLQHCKLEKLMPGTEEGTDYRYPRFVHVVETSGNQDTIALTANATPVEIPFTECILDAPGPGVFTYYGGITVSAGAGETGKVFIRPEIGQLYAGDFPDTYPGDNELEGAINSNNDRPYIGFNAVKANIFQAIPHDPGDGFVTNKSKMKAKLWVKADANMTLTIKRFSATLRWDYSDNPNRLIQMSATGLTEQTQNYPPGINWGDPQVN